MDWWVRYYPPDVFPSILNRMNGFASDGTLLASEVVLVELSKKDDDLHRWARTQAGLFVPVDGPLQQRVNVIVNAHTGFVDPQSTRDAADPFVIALAEQISCPVITGEKPGRLRHPKIPDVCRARQIRCLTLVDMFREVGVQV
jgi:hypothetical protein